MAGAFDAQSEITNELRTIPAGESSLEFEVGPIYLRKRLYYISITINDQTKKVTLVHAIGIAVVDVYGPLGFGLPYQIPAASVERRNGLPLAPEVHELAN